MFIMLTKTEKHCDARIFPLVIRPFPALHHDFSHLLLSQITQAPLQTFLSFLSCRGNSINRKLDAPGSGKKGQKGKNKQTKQRSSNLSIPASYLPIKS